MIKSTNYQLRYLKTGQPIVCYADADWYGDANRKSYLGHIFTLAGSVFSWESKKQVTVALNSSEPEYMALSLAANEAVFLRKILGAAENHWPENILIYGDNLGALHLVKNPIMMYNIIIFPFIMRFIHFPFYCPFSIF